MRYALNLATNNRILSACVVLPYMNYTGMVIVDHLPIGETDEEKDVHNWLYLDGQYIYDPLPVAELPDPTPTTDERITALEETITALIGGISDAV